MNLLTGNLLPMTTDRSSFSLPWKVYSTLVWIIQLITIISMISGSIFTSTEKVLKDGLICFVIIGEMIISIARIYSCRDKVRQFIRQVNDMLHTADKNMRNIVMEIVKPVEIVLTFYSALAVLSVILWSCVPLQLLFEKSLFWYEDCRIPITLSTQPFSPSVFLLISLFVIFASTYMFFKKIGVDLYMLHLVMMMTVQYRYIAIKIAMIFHEKEEHSDDSAENRCLYSEAKRKKERELMALYRRHNSLIHIASLLKEILSINFSFIYMTSVFRFCFIGVLLSTLPLLTWWEGMAILCYAVGAVVQLYVICSCVQQLLTASMEITDKAFHEAWYLLEISVKRTFMMIIMANKLECSVAKIGNFNLSLPSFMAILNQSYSICLLFLRMT